MAAAGPSTRTNSDGATSTITVVFIGHHQSGKSSAVGHLLVRTRAVDKRTLDRVDRDTSSRPLCRFSWVSGSPKCVQQAGVCVVSSWAQNARCSSPGTRTVYHCRQRSFPCPGPQQQHTAQPPQLAQRQPCVCGTVREHLPNAVPHALH